MKIGKRNEKIRKKGSNAKKHNSKRNEEGNEKAERTNSPRALSTYTKLRKKGKCPCLESLGEAVPICPSPWFVWQHGGKHAGGHMSCKVLCLFAKLCTNT